MPKLVGFGLVKSDSFVDVSKEYPVQFFVVSDHCALLLLQTVINSFLS